MSEVETYLQSIGNYLPLMVLGVLITYAVVLAPSLPKIVLVILFGVKIEFYGIEEDLRDTYILEAHATTDTLGRDLRRYTRIIVTPSRIYYLILGSQTTDFNRKRMSEKVGLERVVIVASTTGGTWVCIDHNGDVPVNDVYDPRPNIYPEQRR